MIKQLLSRSVRLGVRVFLIGIMAISVSSGCMGDERADFFESQIRPLLLEKCIECHGPTKQENGVRFDRRTDVLQGKAGDAPLLVAGNPSESRLVKVLEHAEEDVAMPPAGKLDGAQREAVAKWIADGAIWPENSTLEGEARRRAEQWREHWAFQPVKMPDLSAVPPDVNPVDYFIDKKLAEKGLKRSEAASARTLVRRLSFALVGLPPELTDLNDAETAETNGGYSEWKGHYIDRLLASPQFGERWGRYWLDISRYSDTKGYVFTEDREYPDAWRYREWVIRSLNNDMPYDEFLKRQVAADQMPGADDSIQLAAMGYLTLGRRFLNNQHDIIDDRIDVVSRGMLGLTVTCARCHDHKFDPIPTADYYSLYGIFASSDEPKNEPSTLRLVDRAEPVEPVIFRRGSPHNPGDQVPRRFFSALSKPDAQPFKNGSGRMELANAIADSGNPLTGRVAVNRVWMHLFAQGLVESPSDFGVRTAPPTHPELLDYLTSSFTENHWSIKSLIRQMVSSETWQQKSDRRPDADKVDPENRRLARMHRSRLDFEAHRDAILAVSGRLDQTVGGKSADIAADPNSLRRTIYARIDRQNLPGVFRTFDLPSPDAHAARRFETSVPQQALFQLNNPFVMNRATDLAQQAESVAKEQNAAAGVRVVMLSILQRGPAEDEVLPMVEFVRKLQQEQRSPGGNVGWSYGYGTIDDTSSSLTQFTVFPFVGEGKWQGGPQQPDAVLGWASLQKMGGHPGGNLERCVIRRWTADVDSRLLINVALKHQNEMGDGVRLRALHSGQGVLADIVAQNSTTPFATRPLEVRAGDNVDFVVDCRSEESHDSFESKILVTQLVNGKVQRVWNSEDDFRDQPGGSRLSPWAQLAQTLLLTNEFVFVD